jgi:DNA helicase II / ATP-dependent DNA helicase PcrA
MVEVCYYDLSMNTLNEAQDKAVKTTEGPVLIIAGAGAGKTRVITHRILHLIEKGTAPSSILAITFTNKAAKEMRDRVNALVSNTTAAGKPFVSTFHSLGVHIIRENALLLGLHRHFTIADRSDSRRAIKEALDRLSLDPKTFDPGKIIGMISRAKGEGLNRLAFADHAAGYYEEKVAAIWEIYDTVLAKEKSLDFDDLLLKTAELLATHTEVRKKYNNIWKYVHIDEYQDTNKVQYRIAKYLSDEHRNICVVGDIDQNIYSWRGATIENILNFEKDYPDATVITLEQNYRSTKTILTAANDIIEKNTMRRKKTLYTNNDHGEKISLSVNYTESDEARTIADEIRSLIHAGSEARNIAVLYRTNFQSRILEEFFIKKNIAYQLVGTRFFERKEIKDVLSYIRAALNREAWGDIMRCINVPPRGIGKVTMTKLAAGGQTSLPIAMQMKINNYWKLLDDIARECKEKKPSLVVKFVIQETGLERALREGTSEDEERILNVQELVSVATQYDHLPPEEGMETFLSNAALASDQDDLEKDQNAVKLMTIHASKGLEFDHVFISGLEQDLFPLKHMNEADISQAEEEEERRIFYVALTRARKKLYLSHSMVRTIYGSQRVNTPSEFIADIQKSLIHEHNPGHSGVTGAKAIFIDF